MSKRLNRAPRSSQNKKNNNNKKFKNLRRRKFNFGFRRRTSVRSAPVALGFASTTYADIVNRNGEVKLRFREIFPVVAPPTGSSLTFALPIAPQMWTGTRTQTLSTTWQSFKPLSLNIRWMPTCPTTTQGTISFGTIVGGIKMGVEVNDAQSIHAALCSTHGGFMTSVWRSAGSSVKLKGTLTKPLYPTSQASEDEIPLWVAAYSDWRENSNDGYLILSGTFKLANPGLPAPTAHGRFDCDIVKINKGTQNEKTFVKVLKSAVQSAGIDMSRAKSFIASSLVRLAIRTVFSPYFKFLRLRGPIIEEPPEENNTKSSIVRAGDPDYDYLEISNDYDEQPCSFYIFGSEMDF